MTWHENCNDFDSRIEASSKDANFNDMTFLLIQPDAVNPAGDKVSANKAILALMSPVFYAQFYGPLATTNHGPIEILDGTAKGFKKLIKFINKPNSYRYELKVREVAEFFDISYFAHKYQIRSLISLCRQSLAEYDISGNQLDVLNWAVTSECGLELKQTFPAEHALLVHNCWKSIKFNFRDIFPNRELKDDQDLIDEGLMIRILKRPKWLVDDEFVLSVAMDYYCKLIDKGQKVGNKKKKKIDMESKWFEKLEKIKSVVQFENVRPKKMAEFYEKFLDKVPSKVICTIGKEISSSWKDKDTFGKDKATYDISQNTDGDNMFEIPFSLVDRDSTSDCIHDESLKSDIQIKFKTNQNAVMDVNLLNLVKCSCSEVDCFVNDNCCEDDSITFQNENSKDEVTFRRICGEGFLSMLKKTKKQY